MKATQLKMRDQELMQLITASMSTKKDSAMVHVIGSSLIIEPASVATIAPDVVPSIEVEPHADLHMREVSKNPLYLPHGTPVVLPRSPSHSQS